MTQILRFVMPAAALLAALSFHPLFFSGSSSVLAAKQSADRVLMDFASDSVGFTTLHLQTGYSLSERLDYNPELQLVRIVWMAAIDDAAEETRASYYSLFEVGEESLARISDWKAVEVGSAGWPSLVSFSDGTIGVSSHTPAQFSKNSKIREESFLTFSAGPPTTVFPRASVGTDDVVHMVYTFITGSNERHLFYGRSTDEGQTWSNPLALSGSASPGGIGPRAADFDVWALASKGDHSKLIYVDVRYRLQLRESDDNGASWSSLQTLWEPEFATLHDLGDVEGGVAFRSDTVFAPGRDLDILLDENGVGHIVFPVLQIYISGVGSRDGSSIVRDGKDTVYVDELAFTTFGLGYMRTDREGYTIMGRPAGDRWDGAGQFLLADQGANLTRFPQLGMDEDGVPYCVYTSVRNGDVRRMTVDGESVDALYGHVFVTHELEDGGDWSLPLNLTPEGKDCLYGALANVVDDHMTIAWQQGDMPGLRSAEDPVERDAVRLLRLHVDSLSDIATDVVDHRDAYAPTLHVVVQPNPFQTKSRIIVAAHRPGNLTVTIYDRAGRRLAVLHDGYSSGVEQEFLIDARNFELSGGMYYCSVSNGRELSTVSLMFVP